MKHVQNSDTNFPKRNDGTSAPHQVSKRESYYDVKFDDVVRSSESMALRRPDGIRDNFHHCFTALQVNATTEFQNSRPSPSPNRIQTTSAEVPLAMIS